MTTQRFVRSFSSEMFKPVTKDVHAAMTCSTVSVVIPHYGDPAPTIALVDSLKRQKDASGASSSAVSQITVADDCSPEAFPQLDGITLVRRDVNGGFGSAVNSGVAASRGDLALVLNSDLEIGDTFVEELLAAARPWQPAVFSPQVVGHTGAPQWVGRHFPTVKHQVTEWLTPLARFRHLPWLHENVGHDTRCVSGTIVPVDWVVGAAMLIPVAQFRQVGGFDERFFMNSEEVDLQRRLRGVGVISVFLGTVCVTHEGGGSSDPERRRHWLVSSRFEYARKWGSSRSLVFALRAASWVNFGVNSLRQCLKGNVNARDVLRTELGYLEKQK